ncbi:MAG: hypothetical protein QXY74_07215 [Candidatus Bathyarchaeia archaeon]
MISHTLFFEKFNEKQVIEEVGKWCLQNDAQANLFTNKLGVIDHVHIARQKGDGVIEISLSKRNGKLEVTLAVHDNHEGDWAVKEMSSIRDHLLASSKMAV